MEPTPPTLLIQATRSGRTLAPLAVASTHAQSLRAPVTQKQMMLSISNAGTPTLMQTHGKLATNMVRVSHIWLVKKPLPKQ